jgi:hypothetical protein
MRGRKYYATILTVNFALHENGVKYLKWVELEKMGIFYKRPLKKVFECDDDCIHIYNSEFIGGDLVGKISNIRW